MAHFRGVIRGQRGEASRLGSKASGIRVLLQTWSWNVQVTAQHQDNMGRDLAYLSLVHSKTGEELSLGLVNLSNGTIINGPCVALQGR